MKTFVISVCVFVICVSSAVAVPTVTIDYVSSWGCPTIEVRGHVGGVPDPTKFNVFVSLAPQGVGFWSKPNITTDNKAVPTLPDASGNFSFQYTVGNTYELAVMDRIASDFVATLYPVTAGLIPADRGTPGITNYGYTAIGYYERPWYTTVNVSGQTFGVKSSFVPAYTGLPSPAPWFNGAVGPGWVDQSAQWHGNVFFDSHSNTGHVVLQDGVHVDMSVYNGLCAEIVARDYHGWGTYSSLVNVVNIPAGVTVAPGYLFDVFGDVTATNINREADIELGDVALKQTNGARSAQFAMQGDLTVESLDINPIGLIRSTIAWRPDRIDFKLENLTTSQTKTWGYTGQDLPTDPGHTQFRINAWISNQYATYNQADVLDMTVQSFNYAAGDNGTMIIAAGEVEVLNKISGTGDLIVNGTLTVGSIVQDSLTIGAGGAVIIRETIAQAGEVPEPGIVLLLCSGLVVIFCKRHIKRLK